MWIETDTAYLAIENLLFEMTMVSEKVSFDVLLIMQSRKQEVIMNDSILHGMMKLPTIHIAL